MSKLPRRKLNGLVRRIKYFQFSCCLVLSAEVWICNPARWVRLLQAAYYATLALMVERRTCNADVVSSNLTGGLQFGMVCPVAKTDDCKSSTLAVNIGGSTPSHPITFNFILGRSW